MISVAVVEYWPTFEICQDKFPVENLNGRLFQTSEWNFIFASSVILRSNQYDINSMMWIVWQSMIYCDNVYFLISIGSVKTMRECMVHYGIVWCSMKMRMIVWYENVLYQIQPILLHNTWKRNGRINSERRADWSFEG